MATTPVDPVTLAQRKKALDLLQQLFKGSDGKTYFGFNGNTYLYTGNNADGTINAFDVTTSKVAPSIDPLSIVAANASSLGPQNNTNNNTTNNGNSGQTLLSLLGTGTQLYGSLKQASATSQSKQQGQGQNGALPHQPIAEYMSPGPSGTTKFDLSKVYSLGDANTAATQAANNLQSLKDRWAALNQSINGSPAQVSNIINVPVATFPNQQIQTGLDASLYKSYDDFAADWNKVYTAGFSPYDSTLKTLNQQWKDLDTTRSNLEDILAHAKDNQLTPLQIKQYQGDLAKVIGQRDATGQSIDETNKLWEDRYNKTNDELAAAKVQYDKVKGQEALSAANKEKLIEQAKELGGQDGNGGLIGEAAQKQADAKELLDTFKTMRDNSSVQLQYETEQVWNSKTGQYDTVYLKNADGTWSILDNGSYKGASADEIAVAERAIGPQGKLTDDVYLAKVKGYIDNSRSSALDNLTAADFQKGYSQALQNNLGWASNELSTSDSTAIKSFFADNLHPTDEQINSFIQNHPDLNSNVDAHYIKDLIPTESDAARIAGSNAIQGEISTAKNDFWNEEFKSLRGDEIKLGITLASTIGTAYGFETQMENMWRNGASFKSIAETIGLFAGFAGSMHVMNSAITDMLRIFNEKGFLSNGMLNTLLSTAFGKGLLHGLKFLTSGYGTAIATLAMFLVAMFAGTKPSDEEAAAADLIQEISPNVWSDGPVLMLTAGLTLSSMGINLGPNAPMMQTMTVPQVQLTQALQTATGGQMPNDAQRYGSVFVMQGSGSQPTRVIYLTPGGVDSKGNIMETAHVQTLDNNVTFANPGSGTYIPFFIKDSKGKTITNPKASTALTNQNADGNCALKGQITAMSAEACALAGGQWSHNPGGGS